MEQKIIAPGLYSDADVKAGVRELFDNESFVPGMKHFLGSQMAEQILEASHTVSNSFEFQRDIVRPFLQYLKKNSLTNLSSSGLDQLDPKKKYLFISNHRDIGLDSAFLNLLLFDKGFTTTQIAIGDNLVKHRVAELIFRINKSFVVHRSGPPRELYKASLALSSYIKDMVQEKQDSIWIAQREGRAKDGNDQTQVSLLKMLAMSKGEASIQAHFNQLNIVPVSIAYEFNPSDLFMTKEYVARQEDPNYKKTFADDMASILQGLKGQKGEVHIAFGSPIVFAEEANELRDKAVLQKLAEDIDRQIHQLYRLAPINHYAYQKMYPTAVAGDSLAEEQLKEYEQYFDERLSTFASAQRSAASDYLHHMYANPVKNFLQ